MHDHHPPHSLGHHLSSLIDQPNTEPDADVPPFLLWRYHPTRTEGLLPCHDWLPPLARRSHAPPLWTVHAAAKPSDGSEGTDECVQPHEQSPHTAPCWAEDDTARHPITAGREQLQQTVLSLCYCGMSSFYYSETVIFFFFCSVQPSSTRVPATSQLPSPRCRQLEWPSSHRQPKCLVPPHKISSRWKHVVCAWRIFCNVKRWY